MRILQETFFRLFPRLKMQLPRKLSAHNVMASISRTLGNRERKSTGNEILFAGDDRKDKLYEPKHRQKLVRIMTVVAYVVFVSMAAILLSLYYTFLWDPKDVIIKMRPKPECISVKMQEPPTIPPIINDLQIEKMTMKTVTLENKNSDPLETLTTQQQKDLLMILIEKTTKREESSTVPSSTVSEDYQTDPILPTKFQPKDTT